MLSYAPNAIAAPKFGSSTSLCCQTAQSSSLKAVVFCCAQGWAKMEEDLGFLQRADDLRRYSIEEQQEVCALMLTCLVSAALIVTWNSFLSAMREARHACLDEGFREVRL
jgi:hypothetical protein